MVDRLNTLRELAGGMVSSRRAKTASTVSSLMQRTRNVAESTAESIQQSTDRRMAEWVAAIRENRMAAERVEPAVPSTPSAPTIGGGRFARPPQRTETGDVIPPEASFPVSLIETESGGNLQAYNDVVGYGGHVGHGGRLQFGGARLLDAAKAGVIPEMTAYEFSQQPLEVQQRVENWHFNDINNYIDRNGLDRFIGTEIAGIPITRNGIIAMAHLGGSTGARRFLETGGEYNPSDGNTFLSDYARTHQ